MAQGSRTESSDWAVESGRKNMMTRRYEQSTVGISTVFFNCIGHVSQPKTRIRIYYHYSFECVDVLERNEGDSLAEPRRRVY